MIPWIKSFTADLNDPTLGMLSWAEKGLLQALRLLAGARGPGAGEPVGNGHLDSLPHIAWSLRCAMDVLKPLIEALEAANLISHDEQGMYYVSGHADRQKRPPSASKEAQAERQRKHRRQKKDAGSVTPGHDVTSRDSHDVTACHAFRGEEIRQEEIRQEEIRSEDPADSDRSSSDVSEIDPQNPIGRKALHRASIRLWESHVDRALTGEEDLTLGQLIGKHGAEAVHTAAVKTLAHKPRSFPAYLTSVLQDGAKARDSPAE